VQKRSTEKKNSSNDGRWIYLQQCTEQALESLILKARELSGEEPVARREQSGQKIHE
jgi:hypothetical protein